MPDGSGTLDLRYLIRDVDRHGKERIYFRRKGKPKIALKAPAGSRAFLEKYRQALHGDIEPRVTIGAASPGSLRHLCQLYYGSAEYKGLSPRTRHVRKLILDGLCRKHGSNPVDRMESKHVRTLRDEKAEFPEAANARLKQLRQVFKWAVEAEHMKRNPALDISYIRTGSDGFHTWSIEEVRQYEKRHAVGTKARLALDLLLCTGGRRSDAVRLGPQMERANGTEIHFTEAKGRTRMIKQRAIPILQQLRQSIDAAPSGHLAYLVTHFGKPFTSNGFGNWFRDRCDEAGLPHCTAHGLRKAGATIAAERGATEHQLMAIYGWESTKQAAIYTKKANRGRLVRAAMHLIVPEQEADESVQPKSGLDNFAD